MVLADLKDESGNVFTDAESLAGLLATYLEEVPYFHKLEIASSDCDVTPWTEEEMLAERLQFSPKGKGKHFFSANCTNTIRDGCCANS